MPLAEIWDEFHPPEVNRLRAKARAGAIKYVGKLDIGRAKYRDWFFSDPYVAPDPRPCPPDINPMEFLMDSHDDDAVEILPSDVTRDTLARATDPANLPDQATFAALRDAARHPAGFTDLPDEAADLHPRRATLQRQAMVYSLFHDPFEAALTGDLTPLAIMEAVSRRLVANGCLLEAARVAAAAAPYRHPRQALERTVAEDET